MDRAELLESFQPFFNDLEPAGEAFSDRQPLLAHYTSLAVLEQMLLNDEIWFSNPLFMNDLEEVRFGLGWGRRAFMESTEIREVLGDDLFQQFEIALQQQIDHYDRNELLDTYVFCLSEHRRGDVDGLLSMWRGYGGQGKGVAIVFDTSVLEPVEGSAISIGQVKYAEPIQRHGHLLTKCSEFAGMIQEHQAVAADLVPALAEVALEYIKLNALYSKHHGFSEEREWRVVYLRDRDTDARFADQLSYHIGPRGLEPKLKLKIRPVDGHMSLHTTFNDLIASILLGPSISNVLVEASVRRMLQVLQRPALAARVQGSTIPFRGI